MFDDPVNCIIFNLRHAIISLLNNYYKINSTSFKLSLVLTEISIYHYGIRQ